jgi:hypothetical protein
MNDDELSATETASHRGLRRKTRWSDLSSRQQTVIVVGAIAEVVITTIALRDLARRPASQVRGPKLLWLPAFFVQPFGPILYFVAGRRPAA